MPEAAKVFPDGYFNCCISSPPYWALRDYGVDGQLGLEKTFEEYIDKLCTIYDEVKRVLRDDGTCWVNLGDTYGKSASTITNTGFGEVKNQPGLRIGGIDKCLMLIPQRFAIEMVNRGWILRNVIIWHKPNPMPSSAKDRFTVDFEYVYFFVKSKRYWFEPQYEPYLTESNADRPRMGQGSNTKYQQKRKEHKAGVRDWQKGMNERGKDAIIKVNPLGRNKRTVWTIPTQPYPEAHFATFPEKLVEPMIKAGCPGFVCTKCGKAREKIYDLKYVQPKTRGSTEISRLKDQEGYRPNKVYSTEHHFKGYTDCGCNAEFRPGIVMDIFAGSGTTLQVAARLRRDWLGVELKPEYIKMAEKRARQGETGISVKEQKQGQQALF